VEIGNKKSEVRKKNLPTSDDRRPISDVSEQLEGYNLQAVVILFSKFRTIGHATVIGQRIKNTPAVASSKEAMADVSQLNRKLFFFRRYPDQPRCNFQ